MPLTALIEMIREQSATLPITVYLNDLPDNRYDIALKTITESMKQFEGVHYYIAAKDFS